MGRGSVIGALFGILPGAGGAIATLVSYGVEKRVARDPSRFGKGAVEGIASPEAANNSSVQAAFIPTLTLGIPGDATMAIILSALLIQGIIPGPQLVSEHPDLFWALVASFFIGNLLLIVLNIPLIGVWVRILSIPYTVLYPSILFFICIGVYSVNNSAFDVMLVGVFGALGYAMSLYGFPAAPLLLGFILGPLVEEHLRRAFLIGDGDPLVFFQRPISATFLGLTLALVVLGLLVKWRRWAVRRGPDTAV
jgi:TctA family transporter